MEVNLQIPGIKSYNEDVLFLVIPTMTHSKTVLVMVGSKIIDRAMRIITRREACESDHDLEIDSFWGCHVWVTTATPHGLKQNWGRKGGSPFLTKG